MSTAAPHLFVEVGTSFLALLRRACGVIVGMCTSTLNGTFLIYPKEILALQLRASGCKGRVIGQTIHHSRITHYGSVASRPLDFGKTITMNLNLKLVLNYF